MPFVKGQSGNPGGRPKAVLSDGRNLTEVAREHTRQAVETLAEVMLDASSPPAARIAAASSLLDRGWGRPAQAVAFTAVPAPAMDPEAARATIERFLKRA